MQKLECIWNYHHTMFNQNILAPFKTIWPNVDGFVTFEQLNWKHEHITVDESHARIRNMVNLTDWLYMQCWFQLIPQSCYSHYLFNTGTEHLKIDLFQGETCIYGIAQCHHDQWQWTLWILFKTMWPNVDGRITNNNWIEQMKKCQLILLFSGSLSNICYTKLDILLDIWKLYSELFDLHVVLNSERRCQSVAFNFLSTLYLIDGNSAQQLDCWVITRRLWSDYFCVLIEPSWYKPINKCWVWI